MVDQRFNKWLRVRRIVDFKRELQQDGMRDVNIKDIAKCVDEINKWFEENRRVR